MAKAPQARKNLLPQTSAQALRERFKDYPAIDVIARRLSNPNDPGSLPILLKDEDPNACANTDHQRVLKSGAVQCHLCRQPARVWHVHYCNTNIEGRWAQMKSKGYIPVQVSDLADTEDVSDLVKQKEETGDMWVRRGDRGKEILMKQPLEIYNYIKREQARIRRGSLTKQKLNAELAERAGAELGDEAGETIHRGGITVESMTSERTTLAEEAE